MRPHACILLLLTACAHQPAAPAPGPVAARDTVVTVTRVSGLSFPIPKGVVRLVPNHDSLVLHVGDSVMGVVIRVEGRDSADRPIAVPVTYSIMARSPVAKLGGGYIIGLEAGTTTLFVLYDPSFADANGIPRDDPAVAKVRIIVKPRDRSAADGRIGT